MRKVIFIIISIALIISCESEENLNLDNSFIIDCSDSNLNIEELNVTYCSPAPFTQSYILDVSDIGRISFQSHHQVDTSVGYNINGISISYLTTSIDIAIIEIKDTLFECRNPINDTIDHNVRYNAQSDYECENERDIIRSEYVHYAVAFNNGDTLSTKIDWAPVGNIVKIPLTYLSYLDNSYKEVRNIFERQEKYGLWNNQGKKLLCFRYFDFKLDRHKYFWIEMEVVDNSTIKLYRLFY